MPHLSCANLCKVTIEVPKDNPPNLLKIHQDSKDISKYVQLTAHNVEIETLMIRGKGGNRDGSGIALRMRPFDLQLLLNCI